MASVGQTIQQKDTNHGKDLYVGGGVDRDGDRRKTSEDWGEIGGMHYLHRSVLNIKLPKNKQLKNGQQWTPVLVRYNEENVLFISAYAVHYQVTYEAMYLAFLHQGVNAQQTTVNWH